MNSKDTCRDFLHSHDLAQHQKLGIAEITISMVDVQKLNKLTMSKRMILTISMDWEIQRWRNC